MPPFEPALEEDLSDTNLARLLAADARSASQKYSTQGLSALLGGRSQAAPKVKPNTRFLHNLVKNADTHNDRLKRKEDAERREKLRKLDEQEEERRRDERAKRNETQEGQYGPERKRRRLGEAEGNDTQHHHRGRHRQKRHRQRQRRNTSSGSAESRLPARSKRQDDQRRESHREHRRRGEDHASNIRSDRTDHHSHRKHTRRRTRSPSPVPQNVCQDGDEKDRSPPEAQSGSASDAPREVHAKQKPKSSHRRSRLDAYFTAEYDPSADVHPNSDEDSDWGRALNAIRDRANFQRTQSSRLLAAGFSEEQVKKWESQSTKANDGEGRDVTDVKWKAKGEEREWDKGKPLLGEDVTFSDAEDPIEDGEGTTKTQLKKKKTGRQEGWKKSGGLLRGFKNALGS